MTNALLHQSLLVYLAEHMPLFLVYLAENMPLFLVYLTEIMPPFHLEPLVSLKEIKKSVIAIRRELQL